MAEDPTTRCGEKAEEVREVVVVPVGVELRAAAVQAGAVKADVDSTTEAAKGERAEEAWEEVPTGEGLEALDRVAVGKAAGVTAAVDSESVMAAEEGREGAATVEAARAEEA